MVSSENVSEMIELEDPKTTCTYYGTQVTDKACGPLVIFFLFKRLH